MEKIILVSLYIIAWLFIYAKTRSYAIRTKDWKVNKFLTALLFAFACPITLPLYTMWQIFEWKFWDKDLPKWF